MGKKENIDLVPKLRIKKEGRGIRTDGKLDDKLGANQTVFDLLYVAVKSVFHQILSVSKDIVSDVN